MDRLAGRHADDLVARMNRLQQLQDWGMAWALGLGLLALGAAIDQREEEMVNLNTPAIESGLLTAEALAEYRSQHEPQCCTHDHRCDQGRLCPMRMPAEAATDIGAEPNWTHHGGWVSMLWLRIRRALT